MNKVLVVILAGLLLTAFLLYGFYAFFMYSVKAMHRKQTVAENVQITSDWLEITPENPLEATKQVQKIMLSIEGYEHDIEKNDFGNIKLADGTNINPEVQIVDENGKIYQLLDGMRLGNDVGFTPNQDFQKKMTFKSVRIRSNKSFRCQKIYWYDYDLK